MSNKFRSLLPSLFRYTNPPINTPVIESVDKTLILLAKEDHIKVMFALKKGTYLLKSKNQDWSILKPIMANSIPGK